MITIHIKLQDRAESLVLTLDELRKLKEQIDQLIPDSQPQYPCNPNPWISPPPPSKPTPFEYPYSTWCASPT